MIIYFSIEFLIAVLLLIGGTWIFQDSLASVLFYLGRENWHYNHSLRCIRGLWGLVFIVCGILLLGGLN